ncbi:MAG: anti-sigma factor [Longimicrobiales bacterium]
MWNNDDFSNGFPGEMNRHLTAQQIQALLDGQLSDGEFADAQEHVVFCSRCQADLEAWQLLYAELGGLAEIGPSHDFAARVLEHMPAQDGAASWRQKVGAWISVGGRAAKEHLSPERVQDYIEGLVPARQVARIEAHISGCAACRSDVAAWQGLFEGLGTLHSLEPAEGFYERVMAQHRVLQLVEAWEPAAARIGAFARVKRLVPRTRRAWAAVAGLAMPPITIGSVLLFEVFSNPVLTPRYLASFLSWKVTELGTALGSALMEGAVESAVAFQAYAFVDFLSGSPLIALTGAVAFAALSGSAGWILYANLFQTRRTEQPYAQASI